jgi:hypothetical protein
MKIMILPPGRTSAVGSRAREWTVQIISWFLNHTRWMHLSTQVSNSYRVPLLRTALDIFLADLGFFVWLWTWAGLSGPELLCTPPVLLRLYNLHPPYFDFYYFSSLFAKALLWTLA